jgi:hypothetical protein
MSFAHVVGATSEKPNIAMINAEMMDQNVGEAPMRAVDPLRRSVNVNTDTANDPMMTSGRFLFPASLTEPPSVTGNKGKTHGANMVRIPAMNDTMNGAVNGAMNGAVKIRLYVPAWRRMITARYRMQEGRVLTRDETAEIDVTLYRRTRIRCVWQPQARNWKERAIIEVL